MTRAKRGRACVRCRERAARPDRTECATCAAIGAATTRKRTAAARAKGVCPTCKIRTPIRGRVTCSTCIARAGDRRKRWRADGLCVDCRVVTFKGTRRCRTCQAKHQAADAAREEARGKS